MLHFSGRILATVCIIVALCLGLGAYMSYAAARTTYLDGIAARMRMQAEQVAAAMETSQAMGIAVTEQTAVPALLTRESKDVPLLDGFAVRLPDRSILFRSAGLSEREGQMSISVHVMNDLGEATALVEAVYASGPIRAALAGLAWKIGLAAFAVALCATALSVMGVLVLLRPLRRLVADPEGRLKSSAAWCALRQAHDRLESNLGSPAHRGGPEGRRDETLLDAGRSGTIPSGQATFGPDVLGHAG